MLAFLPEPLPDEKKIREKTRAFVDAEVRPKAIEDDEKGRFRREAFEKLSREKLHVVVVPKEHGGLGLSSRAYYAGLEELARGSLAIAVTVGVTNLVQAALIHFGSRGQKEKLLSRLVTGEWLGAFSLSEPGSGSDAAALRTTAKRVSGGYRVTGSKTWCSNGGQADLILLFARTAEPKAKGITAFLVPKGTPGFHAGKQEKKLGLRGSTLEELVFEDCFLEDSLRIGEEGQGLAVALSQLDTGRIAIGAVGIGAAREAIERVWKYHARRQQSGIPFPEGVKLGLAGHFAETQACLALLGTAADLKDQGKPFTAIAAQVKLLGSDLAMRVTSDAVEWMEEAGYVRENEVERLMRDAKSLQIVEGTNQIQRVVLARELERMLG